MIGIAVPFRFYRTDHEMSENEKRLLFDLGMFVWPHKGEVEWSSSDVRCFRQQRTVTAKEVSGAIELAGKQALAKSSKVKIIIDLGGPEFDEPPSYELLTGVCTAIGNLKSLDPEFDFLVFSKVKIADGDTDCAFFLRTATADNVKICYGNGTLIGSKNTADEIAEFTLHFLNLVDMACTNDIAKLKSQIVRRIGHFKLNGETMPLYFEGTRAKRAAYNIILEKLKAMAASAGDKQFSIVYECGNSNWFEGALLQAANIVPQVVPIRYRPDAKLDGPPVTGLLVPFVRKGDTIRNILNFIIACGHQLNFSVWSLVDLVHNMGEGLVEKRVVVVNDQIGNEVSIDVECSLKIDGSVEGLKTAWRHLDIEPMDPTQIAAGQLKFSSEEMWGMIFESGVELEINVPKEKRASLGHVPKNSILIAKNASLIASKFDEYVTQNGLSNPRQVVVFHPDEMRATLLARSWSAYSGYATIKVPKTVSALARKVKNRNELSDFQNELGEDDKLTLKHLEKKLTQFKSEEYKSGFSTTAFAIDEFVATGDSLRDLKLFLELLDVKVTATIALASMSNIGDTGVDHVFYEFGYNIVKH